MKQFETVKRAKVNKSAFDLSHERKLSCKIGELVPVLVQEVLPGDKFSIDTQSMIRLAPLIAPLMHRLDAYIHFFYVPNRILFQDDGWEKLITGQNQETVPLLSMTEIKAGSLGDHLGLPLGAWSGDQEISALPFAAYYKIYNDYYRDQNLIPEVDLYGILDENGGTLKKRAWEKDYFTSALPWAQKGDPVSMSATINYKDEALLDIYDSATAPTGALSGAQVVGTEKSKVQSAGAPGDYVKIENIEDVSIDVNELRRATRLQRWLERNARAGSRYVEHLLAHWGVKSTDARLQRPEYIGGGKSPIVISEVLNTANTPETGQGSMSGHGINVGRTNQAYKYCEEHGFIMGILSVIPASGYMQGLPKLFTRKVTLDFAFPEFAQLGEQAIQKGELYFQDDEVKDAETWGYQSRYAEYKYAMSTVHGVFKESLDFWHLDRKFAQLPPLASEFIECQIDNDRVFAVNDAEVLYVQLYHRIKKISPLPFFNDPTM
nr:MAG: major capsid protein [Microvirus sp.]